MKRFLVLFLCVTCAACSRVPPPQIEPHLTPPRHPKEQFREERRSAYLPRDFSASPFPELTEEERQAEWGKELYFGIAFAADFDLYRAITSFKRARFLIDDASSSRASEIDYHIALAYYLGHKYREAVYQVESSHLLAVEADFPAFGDLLLLLYDCYKHLNEEQKSTHILSLLQTYYPENARKLYLLEDLEAGDFAASAAVHPNLDHIALAYAGEKKSIRRARLLNATLPGSGYWYVGQKQTAVTAFLVNGAFLAAAAHFFGSGNVGAGIITMSLESGWYFGGITGAGLAAKSYNERLYSSYAEKVTERERCYPQMMLRYTW